MPGICLIGKWMIPDEELFVQEGGATAFIRDMHHESPMLKFTNGMPADGEGARVNVHWDICHQRGNQNHRPLVKMVLRIKRISDLRNNSEIRLLETSDRLLDVKEYKPLWHVLLNPDNRRGPSERSCYLIECKPGDEENERLILQAAQSCQPKPDLGPIMPPMTAPVPPSLEEEDLGDYAQYTDTALARSAIDESQSTPGEL